MHFELMKTFSWFLSYCMNLESANNHMKMFQDVIKIINYEQVVKKRLSTISHQTDIK